MPLARRGELPGAFRLGHRYLLSRKVLETFLKSVGTRMSKYFTMRSGYYRNALLNSVRFPEELRYVEGYAVRPNGFAIRCQAGADP